MKKEELKYSEIKEILNNLSKEELISIIEGITRVGNYTGILEVLKKLPEIAPDMLFFDVECIKKSISSIKEEKGKENIAKDIQVQCFGPFRVQLIDGQTIKWRTKKTEELFAFFIDSFPKEVSRNSIIEALWDSFQQDRAITHFNTTLYNLKKAFSNYGIPDVIKYVNGFYKLNSEHIRCDLWEKTEVFSGKFKVTKSNINQLEEMLKNKFSGSYFENNDYLWMEEKKVYLQEKHIKNFLKIAYFYREQGECEKALELLKEIIKKDPLNEEISLEIVKNYLLMKDRISALKAFDAYKRKLKIEVKMIPSEEFLKVLGRLRK